MTVKIELTSQNSLDNSTIVILNFNRLISNLKDEDTLYGTISEIITEILIPNINNKLNQKNISILSHNIKRESVELVCSNIENSNLNSIIFSILFETLLWEHEYFGGFNTLNIIPRNTDVYMRYGGLEFCRTIHGVKNGWRFDYGLTEDIHKFNNPISTTYGLLILKNTPLIDDFIILGEHIKKYTGKDVCANIDRCGSSFTIESKSIPDLKKYDEYIFDYFRKELEKNVIFQNILQNWFDYVVTISYGGKKLERTDSIPMYEICNTRIDVDYDSLKYMHEAYPELSSEIIVLEFLKYVNLFNNDIMIVPERVRGVEFTSCLDQYKKKFNDLKINMLTNL